MDLEPGTLNPEPIFYYVTHQDPRIPQNRQSLVSIQDGICTDHYLHGDRALFWIGGYLGDPRN